MADRGKDSTGPGDGLQRSLGVFSASTIIVGSMIGSGIFIAPSIMAAYLAAPGIYLGLWVLGGLLTLCAALCYSELCARLPRAGGQYVFLREAFGQRVGFLYGWTLFLVIQSGFNAAVAIAFAKYLGGVGLPVGEGDLVFSLGAFQLSRAQLVAVGVIAVLTAVNCRGVKQGAFVQNLFTTLKIGAVIALAAVGFLSGDGSFSHFSPLGGTELGPEGLKLGLLAAAGVAMSKALFAYDAWNSVTFVAEEIRDPARSLPRALIGGTLATTLTYLAACAVYLYILPLGEMGRVAENRVAAEVASRLMGPAGLTAVSIAILISTFGCVNGLILSGARVLYALARDGIFFAGCGRIHPRFQTPHVALLVQGVWSAVLALSGSYSRLLTYTTFASLAFNGLTVVGLFVLRRRDGVPAAGEYRTWGYPLTPVLYLLGAGFFVVYIVQGEPLASLVGLGLVLLGLPAYELFARRQRRGIAR
jgi:APA family basic amino acid/polyamine antiporter